MDAIDFVLRELAESEWHSSLPLGGRQLIVAFDPFQLEPYPQHGSVQRETMHSSYQSRMWYLTFGPPGDGVVVVMGFNHRQSKDERFFQILNRIRVGTHTPGDINILNKTSKGSLVPPRSYTRLCLKKDQVAQINYRKLESLPGLSIQSVAIDKYYTSMSVERIRSLRKRLDGAAPEKVELKVGAHIILTRKTEDMLPGTHAVVLRIVKIPSNNYEGVRFELELETCRTSEATGHPTIPCTEENRRFFKVTPQKFDIHSYDCEVIASREQLPVIPAYAMTVHRSQGMTMTHVAIDFEVASTWKPNGMAYVALSRCATSSGLWVKNLTEEVITVSGRAKEFMKDLWKLHLNRPIRIWGAQSLLPFIESVSYKRNASEPVPGIGDVETGSSARKSSTPTLYRVPAGVHENEINKNRARNRRHKPGILQNSARRFGHVAMIAQTPSRLNNEDWL